MGPPDSTRHRACFLALCVATSLLLTASPTLVSARVLSEGGGGGLGGADSCEPYDAPPQCDGSAAYYESAGLCVAEAHTSVSLVCGDDDEEGEGGYTPIFDPQTRRRLCAKPVYSALTEPFCGVGWEVDHRFGSPVCAITTILDANLRECDAPYTLATSPNGTPVCSYEAQPEEPTVECGSPMAVVKDGKCVHESEVLPSLSCAHAPGFVLEDGVDCVKESFQDPALGCRSPYTRLGDTCVYSETVDATPDCGSSFLPLDGKCVPVTSPTRSCPTPSVLYEYPGSTGCAVWDKQDPTFGCKIGTLQQGKCVTPKGLDLGPPKEPQCEEGYLYKPGKDFCVKFVYAGPPTLKCSSDEEPLVLEGQTVCILRDSAIMPPEYSCEEGYTPKQLSADGKITCHIDETIGADFYCPAGYIIRTFNGNELQCVKSDTKQPSLTCKEGYDLQGQVCVSAASGPLPGPSDPKVSCRPGLELDEDSGLCKSPVDVVEATGDCPYGFDLTDNLKCEMLSVQTVQQCKEGFALDSKGTKCVMLEMRALAPGCPKGFLLKDGDWCTYRRESEPKYSCRDGYVLQGTKCICL